MAKVEDQPRLLANAEHIVKAATRAAALTRQLLAFSRKQVLQPRVLDLNAVLQDLEKILRPLVNDGIVMETCLASNLGAVRADQSQIEQVIVNLIVNARDAMAKGGWLTVSTENVDWAGGVSVPKGRYVVLSVKDTGTGMDPEVLAHIFEPFYTTKEVGKGTGLGLSTVYGIVEQSAGYVTVESEPGKGSQFKVFLPRVDAVADGLPQEASSSMQANGHETVLVVEDDPGVLDLAQEVLTNYGYKVLCASHSNGLEEVLREHGKNIDLLLTDVRLPGTTGREIAMRVQEAHPGVRVLYMSGYAALNFPAQGTEAGISFVQKPFTTAQLTEKVREVLDQRKAFAHHAG
jgi:two-component system, cell cycle sensor histidine kinase and response regulator CckA